jgi:hypothetical protein
MKMMIYLWCCLLGITSIAAASGNATKIDLSSPQSTVQTFVASINQYNFKQAAFCVEGAQLGKMTQLSDWEADLKKVHAVMTVSNIHSKVKGTEATVTSTITMKVRESQEINSVTKSDLKLRKHSAKWQILPEDPQKFELVGPQDYLGYTAAFLAHPEAFKEVREAAQGNSCRANLKQLALAMRIFTEDHNGIFVYSIIETVCR